MGDINTNGTFRKITRDQHVYVQDYACRMMVCFLYLIKTANLNSQLTVGDGATIGSTMNGDSIKGQDGYNGAAMTAIASIKCMGLVDYWGNVFEFIEGAASWCDTSGNSTLYYTNDPNKFTRYPTTLDEANSLGWELVGDLLSYYGHFKEFKYEENFPFSLSPEAYINNTGSLINDAYNQNSNSYKNQFIVLLCGGYPGKNARDGLFAWNSSNALYYANVYIGARAFVPGSTVLSPVALP